MESARLGHFEVLQQIGEGGMGVVYKARDTQLERIVAIKVLPEGRTADAERRTRFIHEAKAASALNHPNIVTIHEAGEQDGRTYMVMEFVDGKALSELIPRKGMRITEALRIAAQVADALTAAHAAGIVHRDVKPSNIIVDAQGRVKVLDFGLAKLAPQTTATTADDVTRTVDPLTEEGVVVGSVPYMSPEQAEGRAVDARSDIFSFGAVLYEMVTGRRAFRGPSRASTLVAVLEKEPQPPSETGAIVPPELERLIARCLRKDVNRRSQHMSDVKLALEELRDESASGKLAPSARGPAGRTTPLWAWPAVAAGCLAVALGALAWALLHHHRDLQAGPRADLARLSPDDGHSYQSPAISADGKFVAYASDRSGKMELWVQQVGGGEALQLTHSANTVREAQFYPDGTRILYSTSSADSRYGSIETISTLGGQPRVLRNGDFVHHVALSPDGRQIAFFEAPPSEIHLMVMRSEGGAARELTAWERVERAPPSLGFAWTPDSRALIAIGNAEPWDWYALPVDGGHAPLRGVAARIGAGEAARAAGLSESFPEAMVGNRMLFGGNKAGQSNVWEIGLTPGTWRAADTPRQLTFGTENSRAVSVSATGTVAVEVSKYSADLYLAALDGRSGQAIGVTRRLTQDGRNKALSDVGGEARNAYFFVAESPNDNAKGNVYALDLAQGGQSLVIPDVDLATSPVLSGDGRQAAYSVAEGDSYSVRVGEAGADPAQAREVCRGCGLARRFSPDGRFLLYSPEAQPKAGPNPRKRTVRLLEVASGKDRPWLEHPTESVSADTFGENGAWLEVIAGPPGSRIVKPYFVPWREEPVPVSEWVAAPRQGERWDAAPSNGFLYFVHGSEWTGVRFDSKTRKAGAPFEVNLRGGPGEFKADDPFLVRGPGLVFTRQETHGSVWLMKAGQ